MVDASVIPLSRSTVSWPPISGHDVDGRGVVAHDFQVRRSVGSERLVEPRPGTRPSAGAAGSPCLDGIDRTGPIQHSSPTHRYPLDGPFVESDGVGRSSSPSRRRVEGQLAARVVEHQIVGLLLGVDPATERPGSTTWTRTSATVLAGLGHDAFEDAEPHEPNPTMANSISRARRPGRYRGRPDVDAPTVVEPAREHSRLAARSSLLQHNTNDCRNNNGKGSGDGSTRAWGSPECDGHLGRSGSGRHRQ